MSFTVVPTPPDPYEPSRADYIQYIKDNFDAYAAHQHRPGTTGDGSGTLLVADGSASAPSHSFQDDTNTGMYRVGADSIGLAVAGALMLTVDNTDNIKWNSYSTTWSAAVGSPSIGNGTLTSRYTKIGKTVIWVVQLTAGGTTTFGTSGAWSFTLPVTADAAKRGYGLAFLYDSSTTTTNIGAIRLTSTTGIDVRGHAGTAAVGTTTPWTWATSDELGFVVVYEAA